VTIGDGCRIGAGVCLEGEVHLGRNCVLKSNCALGGHGFGFERDEDGVPVPFPHFGKIVLEDEVWIGACSTIERATLGTTRVGRGCKIDDLVQISHNCSIGADTLIMSGSVLCGGVSTGTGCWIAPGSLLKQKVRLGDGVTVGLGAVVLLDVPSGTTVVGVPARAMGRKSGAG
jgi:UDP-3-O-[3-hydroxymyristoyl] glucosamine N-acyltransferase